MVTVATTPTVINPISIEYSKSDAPRSSFQSRTATSLIDLRIRKLPTLKSGPQSFLNGPLPSTASPADDAHYNRQRSSHHAQSQPSVHRHQRRNERAYAFDPPTQIPTPRSKDVTNHDAQRDFRHEHRSQYFMFLRKGLSSFSHRRTSAPINASQVVEQILRGGNVTTR